MTDAEDVVVRAQGEQQYGRRERHIERQPITPEQVLKHERGQAQGRRDGQHTGSEQEQEQGRHESAQEQHEEQQVHGERRGRDATQVAHRLVHNGLGDRGVTAEARPCAGEARAGQQLWQISL